MPFMFSLRFLLRLDVQSFLSSLFACGCSVALGHTALLYVAWLLSDVVAKVSRQQDEEAAEELLEEEEDTQDGEGEEPLKPLHLCALFGGVPRKSFSFIKKRALRP